MSIQAGQILANRYQIEAPLGKGGMARTFSAYRLMDDLPVVIKELRLGQLENWKAYDLFQREIRTLKNIQHQAIPKFLDSFELKENSDTWYYLVIEKVPGHNLAQDLEQGWRPDEASLKSLALKVLDILHYLHTLSPPVIHRDLKPSNLVRNGEQLFLIDFGAVQEMLRPEGSSTIVGTFGYMAPEQFTGRAVPATDLYSLGATLVHILAGRPPAELPQKELKLDFRPYVHCSNSFAHWLEQLLEPVPERRFQSAHAAREALLNPEPVSITASARVSHETATFQLPDSWKPAGTKVQLERTTQYLQIHIPRGNFTGQTISLAIFAGFWLTFITVWTLGAAMGSIFFALFSIPFWLVGLFMAGFVARSLLMTSELKITPERYQLTERIGNLYQNTKEGSFNDIQSISRTLSYKNNNVPVFALCMEVGVKSVKFGSQLTASEQSWIQSEILHFMQDHLTSGQLKQLLARSATLD